MFTCLGYGRLLLESWWMEHGHQALEAQSWQRLLVLVRLPQPIHYPRISRPDSYR